MDDNYDTEPCLTLTRHDGSKIRFYRSKTNPHAYLPIQDDGTIFQFGMEREDAIQSE